MSIRDGYAFISPASLLMTVLTLTGISLLIWGVVARRPATVQPQQGQQPSGEQPQPPGWQTPQPPYGGQS